MLMFGAGVAVPLLGLGLLSRGAIVRWRGRLGSIGEYGKAALGLIATAAGMLVLTGLNRWRVFWWRRRPNGWFN